MGEEYTNKVRQLVPAKMLAIAAYGESVAAYRYRTLAEKAPTEALKESLLEMAGEEQDHHGSVQHLIDQHFPGSEFVLTAQDKELIIVGPRLLDPHDAASLRSAMQMVYESELQTGNFYRVLAAHFAIEELKPEFKEMADECFEHGQQLKSLSGDKKLLPDTPASGE